MANRYLKFVDSLCKKLPSRLEFVGMLDSIRKELSKDDVYLLLKKCIPHSSDLTPPHRTKKMRKKNYGDSDFQARFNSRTYSLVGSAICDQRESKLISDITESLIDKSYLALALFQLTQDTTFVNRFNEESAIGYWVDQIIENFNPGGLVLGNDPATPNEVKYERQLENCCVHLIERMICHFIQDELQNEECIPHIKFWVNHVTSQDFTIPEIGFLVLHHIVGAKAIEKKLKWREMICNAESLALSEIFVPINHHKYPAKEWKNDFISDVRNFNTHADIETSTIHSYNSLVSIPCAQMLTEWAMAIMMANCYRVLKYRHEMEETCPDMMMPVDLVIDKHSGRVCLRFKNISIEQLENKCKYSIADYVPPTFMSVHLAMFSRMCLYMNSSLILPDKFMFENSNFLFIKDNDDEWPQAVFLPTLPKLRNEEEEKNHICNKREEINLMNSIDYIHDEEEDQQEQVNDIIDKYLRQAAIDMRNKRYNNTVGQLMNDEQVVVSGANLIFKCLNALTRGNKIFKTKTSFVQFLQTKQEMRNRFDQY